MTKFGYPTYGGRDSAPKSGVPSTPGTRNGAMSGASGSDAKTPTQSRKPDKKKWPLRPWDTDDMADDGIVGWTKRHNIMESKKAKKRPPLLDADYYISMKHQCPNIDDEELFRKGSLHPVYIPKPKITTQENDTSVKLKYSQSNVGLIPQTDEESDESKENIKSGIDTYRDSKNPDRERTRDSIDIQNKANLERSNTYMKIKRLLKFSKNDRRNNKTEDEVDEGYSSKTSSAEIKRGIESDGEDMENPSGLQRPEMQRMYSSMIDLSELPSHKEHGAGLPPSMQDAKVVEEGVNGRVKFSYTHQPTILQLPDPDVKLAHDSVRIEKRIDSEDSNWSYAKLKRNKELNRCYKPDMAQPAEESTVYNIDSMKPVTMVLRKISIQNTDQIEPSVAHWGRSSPEHAQTALSNNLGLGSNPAVRTGADNIKECPVVASPDSIISGQSSPSPVPGKVTSRSNTPHCNTSRTQTGPRKHSTITRASSAVSQRELRNGMHRSNVRDVRVVTDGKPKEPMWNHHYSYVNKQAMDGQATNYSIGDLLPAVDRNIYSSYPVNGKYDYDTNREELTTTELLDMNKNALEDGYILLKKGMDMLTGSNEKPTLGPPPFRPNQTRHPLMRNMTVIVSNKQSSGSSSNPVGGPKTNGLKSSSDKGPLRNMVDDDIQTQKKLKEAFTQFYRNRPKEIGKEFRRMQTMWKT